ncbi:MAG: PAS domain-containing sensor histidine kinase [Leptolyngbya sp.]|nr:MAG: PAS domain-containing sensor histidine kinase [Leptolyngbya sp.]
MVEFLNSLFGTGSFIPHGHCYLWKPGLVWLNITSDALIAIAYYSIPITLFYFVKRRRDLPFNWIFLLFGAFIVACGTTHLMDVWTLWHPTYWLSASLKAITAFVSVFTATKLIPIIPLALAIPSPGQLEQSNQALQVQISERLAIETELRQYQTQLENLVGDRTAQLAASNRQMEDLLNREQEARAQAENAKAEIQTYAEQLTLALNAAKMGSWDWDLTTNHVAWTPNHELMFGYEVSTPNLTYDDWASRVHPADLPQVEAAVHQALVNHEDYSFEYRLRLPDGTERWIDTFGRGEYNSAGEPIRMVGMVLDMTNRKLAEQSLQERAAELTRLNAVLEQTTALLKERNQELDQFAYVVSHDLKAPLRAIANLSEWVEEDLGNQIPEVNKHQLQLMRRRVYRLEALINGLLEYSRAGRKEVPIEPVDTAQLLADILDSLAPPAAFQITVEPGMPSLTTKRLLLSQVFSNLIGNGIKHHPRDDGNVTISVQDEGAAYKFAIADDGAGIDPSYHQRIFVIFQTLKARDEQENTGIGLSIVKKIIETEGGSIWLESQPDQGATFYFTWLKNPKIQSDS